MNKRVVVIVGAGPAGLTAALELLRRGGHLPIVLESSSEIGGISRTVNYKGYRMDIGGHRFFSKSDWVMDWWQQIMPVLAVKDKADQVIRVSYQQQHREVTAVAQTDNPDKVMLVRNRLSRIYYLRKFFDYPIKLSGNTLANLGPVRVLRIGISYMLAMTFQRKPERSLEDFLINRFGKELYLTFFKDYTEKVWGVPCDQISAEWGAQRIKGLSILKALKHAFAKSIPHGSIAQKETSTSLIERFLYPKFGPGQLWEEVARQIIAGGGQVLLNHNVVGINLTPEGVQAVTAVDLGTANSVRFEADYVISTMPIKDLVAAIDPPPPPTVCSIASNLPYRDFITVGLLLRKIKRNPQSLSAQVNNCPPDNWIYVQESDVHLGRIQVFNNWSPHLVADESNVWLGLEYFCQEGDSLWQRDDVSMTRLATEELHRIGFIDPDDVLDSHVVRVPKTYPAYFGAYQQFDTIRDFADRISNLFLIGRNGMHRYNNQDHSMLTAKLAVDAICSGSTDKSAIWGVNIDDEYHEEK